MMLSGSIAIMVMINGTKRMATTYDILMTVHDVLCTDMSQEMFKTRGRTVNSPIETVTCLQGLAVLFIYTGKRNGSNISLWGTL